MAEGRFRERRIAFANGASGRVVEIPSASPRNYHQLVSDPRAMPPVTVDGQLFVPPRGRAPFALVVVVPGSLSVAPSHLAHAETFTDMGFACFVLDPFGARGVVSTVANQAQFSFAASAYDVMCAVRVLAASPEIDAARIGLQGHSRGGSAVLSAAMRPLHRGVWGDAVRARAVLAAYPWCGHQALDPDAAGAEIRILIGDQDDWVSPQQAQGFVQALRLRGASASIRIFANAEHSFDRDEPVHAIPDAAVSPNAPTAYLDANGAFVHPITGLADPALVDRDLAVYALKAGFGQRGATIGTQGEQAREFREDMKSFFARTLA